MLLIFFKIFILSTLIIIFTILKKIVFLKLQKLNNFTIKKINRLLPQTQCQQCGYDGCLPYAKAIIKEKENTNKCIPGGKKITLKINFLLNKKFQNNKKSNLNNNYEVAYINENNCIGCTKCSKICPVDAIIGSKKHIHTIVKKWCTGCKLCIPVCPTDCIKMNTLKIFIN